MVTEQGDPAAAGGTLPTDGLDEKLRDLGIPQAVRQRAVKSIPRAIGVLIYGSWARGQAHAKSDVDLLVLHGASYVSRQDETLSISHYTPDQLRQADGTLFGMHLARDGIILHDSDNTLRSILGSFEPPDADRLLERVHHLAAVLDVGADDRARYLAGLCKVARYLLRTAIYATALRMGRPCFSLNDLAVLFSQPELPMILSSHDGIYAPPTAGVLEDLRRRLEALLGRLPVNSFGSLQALVVGGLGNDSELSNLATLAIAEDGELPYEELPKVIL